MTLITKFMFMHFKILILARMLFRDKILIFFMSVLLILYLDEEVNTERLSNNQDCI